MNGCGQEELNKVSSDIVKNISSSVDYNFKQQLRGLSGAINHNLSNYGISMNEDGILNINGTDYNFDDILSGIAKNLVDGDSSVESGIKGMLTGAAIGEALGTALAGPAITTVVGSTLGVAGGSVVGLPLGPIGMIGGAIIGGLLGSKFGSKDRAQELQRQLDEENRRRQAVMDAYYKKLQAQIGTAMDAVESEYAQKATEMLTQAISNLRATINRKIAEGREFNEKIAVAREQISRLRSELEGLKYRLN